MDEMLLFFFDFFTLHMTTVRPWSKYPRIPTFRPPFVAS
jgi:hypothetical protein